MSEATASAATSRDWVVLGRVSGLYGVQGWVKVYSHTEPREGILGYSPLHLDIGGGWRPYAVAAGRAHGKGVVLRFEGIADRDAAAALLGSDIAIRRSQLPPARPGEYYWADLEGLRVINLEGVTLGVVDHLFATGANDVLVVKGERERLLPFLSGRVVQSVDLEAGMMKVDWDADF